MPNWCQNILKISGPEEAMKAFLKIAEDRKFCLETYYPYETPDGEWDYGWCVRHWGTKWDVSEHGSVFMGAPGADAPESSTYMMTYLRAKKVEDEPYLETSIRFLTAWGPPSEGIQTIGVRNPALSFELIYFEAGHGYAGILTVAQGGESTKELEPEAAVEQFGFEYAF